MTSGMEFFCKVHIFSAHTHECLYNIFYCGILQVIQQQHNLVFIFNRHWSNNKATIIVFCLANNIFMVARVVLARRTRRIMIVGWVFCCPLRVVVRESAKYCTLQNFVCKGYTKLEINLILGCHLSVLHKTNWKCWLSFSLPIVRCGSWNRKFCTLHYITF